MMIIMLEYRTLYIQSHLNAHRLSIHLQIIILLGHTAKTFHMTTSFQKLYENRLRYAFRVSQIKLNAGHLAYK